MNIIILILALVLVALFVKKESLSGTTTTLKCYDCPLPTNGSMYYTSSTGCGMANCPANSKAVGPGATVCSCNTGYSNKNGKCV